MDLVFRVSLLPGSDADAEPALLLNLRDIPGRDETLEPVQLLEGAEYRYELLGPGELDALRTDKPEVFAPDDESGRTGRIRPGLHTGSFRFTVFHRDAELGSVSLEIRSRKLDYLTDYRQMLSDIAEIATEAVMERFGTSEQAFAAAGTGDPITLYQRFAFLQSLLGNEIFQAAVSRIVARPYESWRVLDEQEDTRRGIRSRGNLSRQLSAPGLRLPWPDSPVAIDLPSTMKAARVEAVLDNAPNRFVKFALVTWRATVQQLHDAIRILLSSAPADRGLRESEILLGQLDAILGEELFREVGELRVFPSGNQVLQKREGYRDIFRAYVQFELAAMLSWDGGDEVYEAGQRDVATLYEYWAYLQLAKQLSTLCQAPLNLGELLVVSNGALSLELRKGRRKVLRGSARRLGRPLTVEMWYNKGFAAQAGVGEGSWTVGMRPDFSIRIAPDPGRLTHCDPVWVHFDAKYRVEKIDDLLGKATERSSGDDPEGADLLDEESTEAKRDDLLKMHAYRDAIRRSAGAYILYPGDKVRTHRTYTEILPGLGAFTLRPDASGNSTGVEAIRTFLDAILTHTAHQASQHERERFWRSSIYAPGEQARLSTALPFLERPPADTRVLVGFVKDADHLRWIHHTLVYNLRADDRRGSIARELLDFELLLLWGPGVGAGLELWSTTGTVSTLTSAELVALDYPQPRGKLYYCVELTQSIVVPEMQGYNRRWIEDVLAVASPQSLSGVPALLAWSKIQRTLAS